VNAERELNREYKLDLRLAAYNFGSPFSDNEWQAVDNDLSKADIVFVIHVIDGENAGRLIPTLENYKERHAAVIVINCMPDLMRRTRMGRLDVSRLAGAGELENEEKGKGEKDSKKATNTLGLLTAAGSWVGRQVRRSKAQSVFEMD
jgi:hypothetical protein